MLIYLIERWRNGRLTNQQLYQKYWCAPKDGELSMDYKPDNWVVIKISGNDPHYRILAGWSGGYLDGDRWRLNSGITGVTLDGDYYHFPGSSGSKYVCHKDSYGLKMNNAHVWSQLKDLHEDTVELMPEDTDWFGVDWIIDKEKDND